MCSSGVEQWSEKPCVSGSSPLSSIMLLKLFINLFMNIEYIFIIFCIFSIVSALALILVNNPVHSILFLILVFCNISFILILLNVEFIAIIFLIVYVGAIAVLFLFVVMMLNLKLVVLQETFWRYIIVGISVSLFLLIELFCIFKNINNNFFFFFNFKYYYFFLEKDWNFIYNTPTNTELLGIYLYTYGFYPLFLIGLILLIAIIGCIVLTLNQNINIKRQLIYKQLQHDVKSSIKLKF